MGLNWQAGNLAEVLQFELAPKRGRGRGKIELRLFMLHEASRREEGKEGRRKSREREAKGCIIETGYFITFVHA